MARATAMAALCATLVACSAPRIPPPAAPAPTAGNPQDAIPGDLDVVVRVDLARMRDALGKSALDLLSKRAPGEGEGKLFDAALAHADTLWLAFRPAKHLETTDNVIVLSGHFASIEPRALGPWGPATDLGAGWRVLDRPMMKSRSAPVRVYLRGDELIVLASTAEVDAVGRSVEQGAGDAHPDPPAKGAISVAARLPPIAALIAADSPKAARLLRQGQTLSASADIGATGLTAELDLVFDDAEIAKRTAAAAGLLARAMSDQGGAAGRVAALLHIESVADTVVVKLELDPAQLEALRTCASDAGACSK